ncbi:MAG: hypothetical protein COS98_02040 [Parcubacteria group bacterium CG07_land_8_20_14_0_80_35_11]|nr:MAG: hypothetical protein COS98_02040 [Parcubacteria group bacterium CG07_land_8_20_14_0_80_35_11]
MWGRGKILLPQKGNHGSVNSPQEYGFLPTVEELKKKGGNEMKMNRWIGYTIATATAVMTYFVFYYIASLFGATNPQFIAIALTVAMIVHEIMHLIAIEANGIPAQMFFLVIIGGAMPLLGQESKYKKLSWERQAIIALAGVTGNFIVILSAFLLSQSNYLAFNDFLRILNLNGVLILWNLFPLWIWDGGRFAKLLFNSISEDEDTKYKYAMLVCFVAVVITLIIYGKLSFIHLWMFSWGLHWQASHDDPEGTYDPKSMLDSHHKWWAALYLLMICAGAIIAGITPNWL